MNLKVPTAAEQEWDISCPSIESTTFSLSGPNGSIATYDGAPDHENPGYLDQGADSRLTTKTVMATGKHQISLFLEDERNGCIELEVGVVLDNAKGQGDTWMAHNIDLGAGNYIAYGADNTVTMEVDVDAGSLKFWTQLSLESKGQYVG